MNYHRGFIWQSQNTNDAEHNALLWANLYAQGYWRLFWIDNDCVTVIVNGEPTVTMISVGGTE